MRSAVSHPNTADVSKRRYCPSDTARKRTDLEPSVQHSRCLRESLRREVQAVLPVIFPKPHQAVGTRLRAVRPQYGPHPIQGSPSPSRSRFLSPRSAPSRRACVSSVTRSAASLAATSGSVVARSAVCGACSSWGALLTGRRVRAGATGFRQPPCGGERPLTRTPKVYPEGADLSPVLSPGTYWRVR